MILLFPENRKKIKLDKSAKIKQKEKADEVEKSFCPSG
jgi:hypothetical protein